MKRTFALLITLLLLLLCCTAQGEETTQPQSIITPAGFDIRIFDLPFSKRELSPSRATAPLP